MAKVSVIVPIYNVEKFLEKCIQSIQNQSEREIEIILVDDESPDGSPAICDRYAAQDERIQVIHQKNAGVSVARNAGMAVATADWIMFVDGDDWLEENAVEVLYQNALRSQSEIIIASHYMVYEHEKKPCDRVLKQDMVLSVDQYRRYLLGGIVTEALPESFPEELQTPPLLGYPWEKLYNAKFLKDNQLQFVPGLKRMQDMVFNLHTFHRATTVSILQTPIYNYRVWTGSACRKLLPNQAEIYSSILHHMNEFMQTCGVTKEFQPYLDLLAINMAFEYSGLLGLDSAGLYAAVKRCKEARRFVEQERIYDAAMRSDGSIPKTKKQKLEIFMLKHQMYKSIMILTYMYKKHTSKLQWMVRWIISH